MRLEPVQVMSCIFPDIHPVHVKILLFRLRALSHRMMCFGWEEFLNTYEPRERVLLATLVAQQQHDALIKDAYKNGDEKLRAWIENATPHLVAA